MRVAVVLLQVLPNRWNLFLTIVDRARDAVIRPLGLQLANLVQLVNGSHLGSELSAIRVSERERDNSCVVIFGTIQVSDKFNRVSLVSTRCHKRVSRSDASSPIHVLRVGGMNARRDTGKQTERARGFDSSKLDRRIKSIIFRVLDVKLPQVFIATREPRTLLSGGLQNASLTDPHAHVLMHNCFRLRVVRRKHQGVFVDTIEELRDIVEFLTTSHVGQEDFSETASLVRSQTLFSTQFVTYLLGDKHFCYPLCITTQFRLYHHLLTKGYRSNHLVLNLYA